MEFDAVGRLVPHLDEASLHFLRPVGEINKLLAAGAGIGPQANRTGVLCRIRRIERVEGLRVNREARHVLAPVVECHAPRICALVGAKRRQPMPLRLEAKPAAVLLAHRAVRRLDLAVMKNPLTENQVAVGRPREVMQRVVRVFAAKTGEQFFAGVGFAVTVGVLDEYEMRLLRDVHAAVAELERQWDLQVVGEDAGFVSAPVAVGVLEDDDLVVGLVPGINVRVGRRAADPKPAPGIPAHLDWAGQVGEILFGGEQVHLKARIDFECLQLVLRREELVRAPALCGLRQRRDVRVVDLLRHLFAIGQVPDALVAVGCHEVEVSHRWQEVEIAVAAIASAGVIKCVHRPESAEELYVFLQYRRTDLLAEHRRLNAEGRPEYCLGKQLVTVVIEVAAVER